jgi:hypothetical protein
MPTRTSRKPRFCRRYTSTLLILKILALEPSPWLRDRFSAFSQILEGRTADSDKAPSILRSIGLAKKQGLVEPEWKTTDGGRDGEVLQVDRRRDASNSKKSRPDWKRTHRTSSLWVLDTTE